MARSLFILLACLGTTLAQSVQVATTPASPKIVKAIDVHHHFVPDWYRSMVPSTGGSPTPSWTIKSSFAAMASVGADRAIISLSTPGTDVDPGNCTLATEIAIRANNDAAGFAAQFKNISWYAHSPIGCAASAVTAELTRAFNLKPAPLGIAILTSYQGSKYMGDSAFTPVYNFANARGSVIFVHPRDPLQRCGDGELISANPDPALLSAAVEFYQETARGFGDLIRANFLSSYSKISWIAPQMGGHFPSTLDRLSSVLRLSAAQQDTNLAALQTRVWWETAGPTFPRQVYSVIGLGVKPKQWLFGTDFPYAPQVAIIASRAGIDNTTLLTTATRNDLLRNNALKLFKL